MLGSRSPLLDLEGGLEAFVYGGCQRLGAVTKQGMRLCGVHQEHASTPTRRSTRSRSRAREPPPGEDEGDERAEGDGDDRVRRRGRGREVSYQVDEAENILREVREEKEEEPPALRRRRVASPGHTPKSSVQHSFGQDGNDQFAGSQGGHDLPGGVHGADG